MKRKNFRAIIINKYTLVKSAVFTLTAVLSVLFFKSAVFHKFLSKSLTEKLAYYSISQTIPAGGASSLNNLEFLRTAAVKAAGLDMFDKRTDFKYTPVHDPYPGSTLHYTPVESSTKEASAPVTYDTSNIEEKNFSAKGASVTVDNKTSFSVDTNSLLAADVPITNTAGQPLVLIVHTHTTESYTPSEKYNYTPETNARTRDSAFNITRVGEEFAKGLESEGINVIHDKTVNDYPSYNGSYTKTLGVINSYLEKYPSIQIVIDIHRDSMTAADGTKYKVATEVDGNKTAQLMIIMGSSEGGLSHPDWQENLKLGLKLQQQLNSDYNNIARPLSIRKERFNTHATKGSMIVEIGTDANTLDEAILCAQYASKSFAKVIKTKIK